MLEFLLDQIGIPVFIFRRLFTKTGTGKSVTKHLKAADFGGR